MTKGMLFTLPPIRSPSNPSLPANTVKTHALAVYRRVGVTSRDEAITRARQLGLLESPVRA